MSILSKIVTDEIDQWLTKFPADQAKSVLLPALRFAQEDNSGWLSEEIIKAVADYINVPHIAAFEVATFYTMYDLKPVGKHKVCVCNNISCKLLGSEKLLKHFEEKYGAKPGETTADGQFTLKKVECLGACIDAPVMQIDDRDYYPLLDTQKFDDILEGFANKENTNGK